jgi:glycosyltransferase involved in cell wall biosynthesis
VEFRGFREDVAGELARLDILVHASLIPEPFGQVVVEGMAAGLPVVAPRAGGPSEVIEHDVTGLLYEPGDARALASCIGDLADDPGRRDRLGRAATAKARDFAPEIIAAQLSEMYRALLRNRSR